MSTGPVQPNNDANRVKFFDTTLRDGEQSPGITLNTREKLEIAHQLARLGVDVIEAGFPITSPGDFEAVRAIADEVPDVIIAALARANDEGHRRLPARPSGTPSAAAHPHLHRHQRHPPRAQAAMTRDGGPGGRDASRAPGADDRRRRRVLAARTPPARTRSSSPRWSPPRSPRARPRSTCPTPSATRCRPSSQRFLLDLYDRVPELHDVTLSVHCHNDLGLAVANSLAGDPGRRPPGRVRDQRHRRARRATPRSRRW